MSENFYETWEPLVNRIARFVSYDYPDVEQEDLQQDLFVTILERRWTNPDDQGVVLILRKVAKERAAQYRAQHLSLSPQYNYRTSDVRRILERVFEHDDWVSSGSFSSVDEEGTAVPLERGDPSYDLDEILATYSDVKRAWERLPITHRKPIFECYALRVEFDDAGKKRVQRAIEKLTDYLNSYHKYTNHDGPGSRRAISNAKANYIIHNSWGSKRFE